MQRLRWRPGRIGGASCGSRANICLTPFLTAKAGWPFAHDVQHWETWPIRSPGLLFCGLACAKADYVALWKKMNRILDRVPLRRQGYIRRKWYGG